MYIICIYVTHTIYIYIYKPMWFCHKKSYTNIHDNPEVHSKSSFIPKRKDRGGMKDWLHVPTKMEKAKLVEFAWCLTEESNSIKGKHVYGVGVG